MERKNYKVTDLYLASLSPCGNRRCNRHESEEGRSFGTWSQCDSMKYCSQMRLTQHWLSHRRWCMPVNNERIFNNEEQGANPNDGVLLPQLGLDQVD